MMQNLHSRATAPAAALLLAALASCSNAPTENVWGARVHAAVFDEYDFDSETAGGGTTSETVDYNAVHGAIYLRTQETTGVPLSSAEFTFGFAEFDELQSIEFGGGARYYLWADDSLRPWVGAYARVTGFDDINGDGTGAQVSVVPAIGVEYPLTEVFALELLVDYTIPVASAESDTSPLIDREVSGLAVRLGFSVDF